jgi:flagellar basal-body rod modification protein FlgD
LIDPLTTTVSGAPSSQGGAPAQPSRTTLGKDDFLRLLITQLRNQDPLNPLDQNQFLAQTAQFASLEQLQAISRELEALRGVAAGAALTNAAALLGRTVWASGRDVGFDGVSAVSLPFSVAGAAALVTVDVLDTSGTLVRRLMTGPVGAGAFAVDWDGRDGAGRVMTPGTYFYRVAAVGADGASSPVATATSGTLTGLHSQGTQVLYRMGDRLVRPEDIVEIR